jgi:hypothetical protein
LPEKGKKKNHKKNKTTNNNKNNINLLKKKKKLIWKKTQLQDFPVLNHARKDMNMSINNLYDNIISKDVVINLLQPVSNKQYTF